ncbi:ParA family protein [Garciella nitratireducens]|uniref:Sporulation initiation inhibitor protein Soj n=1 Tax=Garciella nitratireducens DSM 15102 TaxID=1121911 RepID=A0A1T4PD92_9FIRM|nr:AAA family ATPase [Garciella nitratireducens]RBP36685.1 chromosome partitioning protein [Garciella nitratireducens]SJZ89555.1 chromosome segregation ATPase [Garciella nitratireducens DSM 15102]
MSKIIAVFNQKGGVGKTTSTINLAASLGNLGKKILVLDIDPQGNATSGLGVDKNSTKYTIYEILIEEADAKKAIIKTSFKNLFVLPSSVDLAGAEIELTSINNRELILKKGIATIREEFDYIFIDCPPSLGLLTINALAASDSVLIPIQCEYYALEGVSMLMNTIQLVKKALNKNLKIEGVILSMFDGRNNLSIQVVDEVKKYFKGKVYTTLIPRNVRLAEAPSYGLPIIEYDAKSRGAEAYRDLAEEFLEYEEEGE